MSKKKKTIKKNSKQTYMEKKTAIAGILRDRKTSPKKERKKVNLSLKQITVKNAEGDPDTTATILIQNQIDYVPKVSVIIPVYNVEQYLRECLDSVVNQTLKEIEIICVDDGSTDSSLEILKEYAQKDKRIVIVTQKNSGSGKARNFGIDTAKGEFIAFMDSDDMYPSDKTLEHLYTAAVKNKVNVCGGSLNQIKEGVLITDPKQFEPDYTFEKDGLIQYSNYQFDFGYWRFVYNRRFLQDNKLKFPNYLRFQDPPFFIKTMILAKQFYALKEPTYVYRVSYKEVSWNGQKVLDFFQGVKDCFVLSSEYGLFDLCYSLTMRLNGQTSKKLFNDYFDIKEINSLIDEITDYMDYKKLPKQSVDENILKYAVKNLSEEIPFISIIVPCYKVEKYLRQCLNSLLKQSLKNIEVICINDGSPDNSLDILREYANIDKRIIIINQENQGLSCARNNAIKIARGEYLWCVDSDDWIRKDACEILYKKAKENSLDILNLARINYDDETGKYQQLHWQKVDYVKSDKEIFSKEEVDNFIENIPISAVGYLYKRKFINDNNISFPEKLLFEDNYFLRKSLVFLGKFGIESKILYFKRTHAGAITRNISNYFSDYIKIIYKISDLYQTHHLDKKVISKIINSYCKNLYSIFCCFNTIAKSKYQYEFYHFLYEMDKLYQLNFDLFKAIEKEISLTYKNICQNNLNLNNPKNYNEKIQWLKLYEATPIKTLLADKYLVRDWVKEKIGNKYLIPLLGVYDEFKEIDFNKLPKQFVIKCNHGCGYNVIVKDKTKLDLQETETKINGWMKENFAFKSGFELHYRDIKPKIIVEKFIENKGVKDLYDYKFWCFNGRVEYIQFLSERNLDGLKMAFYDRNWVKQPFVYSFPLDKKTIEKPNNLSEMIHLSEKLAKGFSHVRVDLYRLNDGKIYFGEMTFTSASGYCKWNIPSINKSLGRLIKLPKKAYNINTGKYYKKYQSSRILPYLLFPYFYFKIKKWGGKGLIITTEKYLNQLTCSRIDIKNEGNKDNGFTIQSPNSRISTPLWMSDEKGKMLECEEMNNLIKMNIKQAGKLVISFRGMFRKSDGEKLPLWIDYKSIKIDGKEILTEPIATWHNKPFRYEMPVKDGQEITLEVEQQYHQYTEKELENLLLKLNPNSDFVQKNINNIIENLKKQLPIIDEKIQQKRELKKKFSEVMSSLIAYRIDVKNIGSESNSVKITADNTSISEPEWFLNAQGIGKVLQGREMSNMIKIKTINDGVLRLDFRGPDKRLNNERLPIWIDYKSIKIDGKEILIEPIHTQHDDPFRIEFPIKNRQEITLEVEQQYHQYTKDELRDTLLKLYPDDDFLKENLMEIVNMITIEMNNKKGVDIE